MVELYLLALKDGQHAKAANIQENVCLDSAHHGKEVVDRTVVDSILTMHSG